MIPGLESLRARTAGSWLGELQFRVRWLQRRQLQNELALALGRDRNELLSVHRIGDRRTANRWIQPIASRGRDHDRARSRAA